MVVPSSSSLETKLFKLMADKEKLESQINNYGEILAQNGNVGMCGPLVDIEGFPRNDIDVYQVRQARQQIICLQNDHKHLMDNIEQLLHELHANAKQAQTSQYLSKQVEDVNLNPSSSNDTKEVAGERHKPILKVNRVVPGSPAETAGLRQNDEIFEFGTVNANNFVGKLDVILRIVNHMVNQRIPLKIYRNNEVLELILIPQTWSGLGLLGCNVVSYNN